MTHRDISLTTQSTSQSTSYKGGDPQTPKDDKKPEEDVSSLKSSPVRKEVLSAGSAKIAGSLDGESGESMNVVERAKGRTPGEPLSEESAVEQGKMQNIWGGFARVVYEDWSVRGEKDASGCFVPWLPYLKKRWNREGQQWRDGTHKVLVGLRVKTNPASSGSL